MTRLQDSSTTEAQLFSSPGDSDSENVGRLVPPGVRVPGDDELRCERESSPVSTGWLKAAFALAAFPLALGLGGTATADVSWPIIRDVTPIRGPQQTALLAATRFASQALDQEERRYEAATAWDARTTQLVDEDLD